jgi:hypothetical protein
MRGTFGSGAWMVARVACAACVASCGTSGTGSDDQDVTGVADGTVEAGDAGMEDVSLPLDGMGGDDSSVLWDSGADVPDTASEVPDGDANVEEDAADGILDGLADQPAEVSADAPGDAPVDVVVDVPAEVMEGIKSGVRTWCLAVLGSAADACGPCNNYIRGAWAVRWDCESTRKLRDTWCQNLPELVALGVTRGRFVVDPEALVHCAEDVPSLTGCGVLSVVGRPWIAMAGCPGAIRGLIPLGGACDCPTACVPGTYCDFSKESPRCLAEYALGEPCDYEEGFICGEHSWNAYCGPVEDDWFCQAQSGPGEPCAGDMYCIAGSFCAGGKCRRLAPARDDLLCGLVDDEEEWVACPADRTCALDGNGGQCVVPISGGDCTRYECPPQETCQEGLCVPGVKAGDTCSWENENPWSLTQDDCERGLMCEEGTCIAPFSVPDGGFAWSNTDCVSGIVNFHPQDTSLNRCGSVEDLGLAGLYWVD